jgi:colicin import membrane protein
VTRRNDRPDAVDKQNEEKKMSGLHCDDDSWEVFLAQRERMPSWKLPFNIAVVLHLLVFAGSVFMPDVEKKSDMDQMIMIDLLSLPPAAPGPMIVQQVVQPQGKKEVVASQTMEPLSTEGTPQPVPEPVDSTPESIPEPVKETVVPPVPEIAPQPKIPKASEVRPQSVTRVKPVSLRPLKRKKRLADDVRLAEVKEQEQREKRKNEQARLAAVEKKRLAVQRKREQAAEKERQVLAQKKKQQKAAAKKRQEEKQAEQQRKRKRQKVADEAARLARQAEQAAEQALLEAARLKREYAAVSQDVSDINAPLTSSYSSEVSAENSGGGGRGVYNGSGGKRINPAVIKQYAASLNGRISNHWRIPDILKKKSHLKAVVALTVRRDGFIEDMKIEQKSGDNVFDQSVLKALQSAAPLPSFPALIDEPTLDFALNFTPRGLEL